MRLAIAQLRVPAGPGTEAERLDATVGAIEAAAGKGAELVVLPELATCGYRMDTSHLTTPSPPTAPGLCCLSGGRLPGATASP